MLCKTLALDYSILTLSSSFPDWLFLYFYFLKKNEWSVISDETSRKGEETRERTKELKGAESKHKTSKHWPGQNAALLVHKAGPHGAYFTRSRCAHWMRVRRNAIYTRPYMYYARHG